MNTIILIQALELTPDVRHVRKHLIVISLFGLKSINSRSCVMSWTHNKVKEYRHKVAFNLWGWDKKKPLYTQKYAKIRLFKFTKLWVGFLNQTSNNLPTLHLFSGSLRGSKISPIDFYQLENMSMIQVLMANISFIISIFYIELANLETLQLFWNGFYLP